MKQIKFILAGLLFGIVMAKSEAFSWYRIQEMFRFQSFHMYGIIGTAVTMGVAMVAFIKKYRMRDYKGNRITIAPKDKTVTRYLVGGFVFGLGWALSGACPGPMFVNLGYGYLPIVFVIVGATLGTFTYGVFQRRLPH